ncbi:PAS domain-containing protein [Steroidobacter sp.]|uniref:PAS domain-containing protein n=1 Tax=Steroidobacter sp. TaxID=1978227 RepID=UPI001A3A2D7D|nr:PAS domain-containing protein [Steroidobacter sp.]MBL8269284.1 PAS domain-containing protein [Steroidobacter sp.]
MTDQAFMQQLALQHGEPVAVASLAGSLMFANPAFAALCDSYSPAALLGINVVIASDGRIATAVLDAALKSDVQQHISWPGERRSSRDFVCTVRCVREDNVPMCLVLTLHSVDALIASHRRERDALESLCEASGLIDAFSWQLHLDEPAAKISWSPHAGAALGVSAPLLPADVPAFLKLILPEDRNSVQRAINDAIEQSASYQVEYRLRSSQGTSHPMIGLGQVVGDASRGSRRLLALELDATGRGLVGYDGVSHERMLSAVLAGTDQPICVLDRQLRYSYFNAAYASLIAATQGVTVTSGAPLLESIQDATRRRRLGASLSRTLKGERLIETLDFDYPESGTRQWIDFSFSPLLSADDRVAGIVTCGQDVSATRHAQHRRRRFNEELQRRLKIQSDQFDAANRELNATLTSSVHACSDSVERLQAALKLLQQTPDEVISPQAASALRAARAAAEEVAATIRELTTIPIITAFELTQEPVDRA